MIMAITALLVGRFQSFASLHEYELYSYIQLPKAKHATCVHHTYLYVVFKRHSKVKFSYATFKTSKTLLLFCVLYSSWESSLQTIVIGIMYSCLISCLLCDNHAVMGMPSICLISVEYHVTCYACPSCVK